MTSKGIEKKSTILISPQLTKPVGRFRTAYLVLLLASTSRHVLLLIDDVNQLPIDKRRQEGRIVVVHRFRTFVVYCVIKCGGQSSTAVRLYLVCFFFSLILYAVKLKRVSKITSL